MACEIHITTNMVERKKKKQQSHTNRQTFRIEKKRISNSEHSTQPRNIDQSIPIPESYVMATKRSSTNPPDYFHHLTKKQQRNWMRTTKGIEKNENLRQEHASFESTSHNKLVHIHRLTSATIIKELIEEAKDIHLYVIDTESEMMEHRVRGAIIQIQMIKTTEQSTVVITETCHLPERNSSLFKMIKQLYSTIFNSGNKIVSWGPYDKEIENFYEYELIEKGEFIHKIDLQNTFQKWHNQQEQIPTHLERGSRDSTTDLDMRTDVQMKSMTSRYNCGHK